jgi:hypothetical protein
MTPEQFLRDAKEGTRVVVRYRLHDDTARATDSIGFISAKGATTIVLATNRGLVTIPLNDVIAAKEVPPAPARKQEG